MLLMNTTRETLVLGATGKTGSRVAAALQKQAAPVRIGSRSGTPPFDWDDERTWEAAFSGTGAAYLVYYPDIAVEGSVEKIAAVTDTALRVGTRRLVLLSGRGEPEAQRAEQALIDSGADWTIVRSAWFNQNFDEGQFVELVRAGVIELPVGDVGEPFVDAGDIADVAIAALTDDRHVGELYEVTGPRLLTFADAVGEIAAASGRDIRFLRVGQADFVEALAEQHVPDDLIALLVELFTVVLDGRNEHLTDGVQRALGREPRDFADYARAAAATGVWSAP
jgi:uncharacterized protein YbjT (DUF2867 family)